jgi:ABC-type glycerol-3-phosphate transport system permease component
MVAYGLARIRWRGRDLLFSIVLATMMIPPQVTMVPLFITYKHLGWVDTYLPLVVPSFLGSAYFIFMLRQFFMTIPLELADAARIDGASEFGIMWRIILPLSKPALAVVILFRFLGAWNDYFGPLIYVNRKPDWTIALAIEFLRSSMSDIGACPNRYPYLMAVSTLTTVPVVIAFFLAQRTFIEGISLTGLKG